MANLNTFETKSILQYMISARRSKRQDYRNLQKEMQKITNHRSSKYSIVFLPRLSYQNSYLLQIQISMNTGAFRGIVFQVCFYIPDTYPRNPPFFYCKRFYPHPNVHQRTKAISLNILKNYNVSSQLSDIIYEMVETLEQPRMGIIFNNELNITLALDYVNRHKNQRMTRRLQQYFSNSYTPIRDEREDQEQSEEYCNLSFQFNGFSSQPSRVDFDCFKQAMMWDDQIFKPITHEKMGIYRNDRYLVRQ